MEAQMVHSSEPTVLFEGSITITALAQNPEPTVAVMAMCDLRCSGTASGFGQALGIAARGFIESLPTEMRHYAAENVLSGFLSVLQPGGASQVQHGGLNS